MRGAVEGAAAALAVAFGLSLAGCGGSDGGDGASVERRSGDADARQAEPVTLASLSAEEVRRRVANQVGSQGDFIIVTDPTTRKQVRVSFVRVHEEVKTTAGGRRSVCVDFSGPDGTVYVVEYYLGASSGEVAVEDRLLRRVGDLHVAEDSVRRRLDAEG